MIFSWLIFKLTQLTFLRQTNISNVSVLNSNLPALVLKEMLGLNSSWSFWVVITYHYKEGDKRYCILEEFVFERIEWNLFWCYWIFHSCFACQNIKWECAELDLQWGCAHEAQAPHPQPTLEARQTWQTLNIFRQFAVTVTENSVLMAEL